MANEKRLIDANEVRKKLRAVKEWFGGPPQTEQDKLAQAVVKMCVEEIDKLKPVDAVEVVRCKDCKRNIGENKWTDKDGEHHKVLCRHPAGFKFWHEPDDFCSDGGRRTDHGEK